MAKEMMEASESCEVFYFLFTYYMDFFGLFGKQVGVYVTIEFVGHTIFSVTEFGLFSGFSATYSIADPEREARINNTFVVIMGDRSVYRAYGVGLVTFV